MNRQPSQPTNLHLTAFRRAIMTVKPEYFSWSKTEQERYGLGLSENESEAIKRSMVKTLFGIETDLDSEFWTLTDEQYLHLDCAMLLLMGIGENHFFLNEMVIAGQLCEFNTFDEFFKSEHAFQQEGFLEYFEDYQAKPYKGDILMCIMARAFINERLYYLTLNCLAGYIRSHLTHIGDALIDELIPSEFVNGKNHGKRTSGGVVWDRQQNAGGLEGQLDELQSRYYHYLDALYDQKIDEQDKKALKKVYIHDISKSDDPQLEIIFSDKTALENVRIRRFMEDCSKIRGSYSEIELITKHEEIKLRDFINSQYQDIMASFNPKIIKFKKKLNITIADSCAEAWD